MKWKSLKFIGALVNLLKKLTLTTIFEGGIVKLPVGVRWW
jgi:hypothetical protein